MYKHKEIEQKWQKYWEENKTFKINNDFTKPKYYTLDMFPYPSGAGLHVGHPEGMTANDIVARYKTAKGFNVLHPMGWDAFGLPAENFAIKTGTHPRVTTDENIKNFRKQIKALGFSYDWDREIDTTDPKYYKWTQWIFLKLFENGLAYEQDLPINYCPSCKTGLANEEVLNDFTCERCGTKVEKKKIRQWVLGITKYAERLLSDVDKLDWPEGIKDMQRNWIGKSEGCEFSMKVISPSKFSPLGRDEATNSFSIGGKDAGKADRGTISVYTTRIDTVFGMTYAVLAPDHKDVMDFITPEQKEACLKYIDEAAKKSDQDRIQDDKEKTGVFTGSYVINPFNGKKVPLWIGDYVLGNYGTGAVMAVPAHDERDFAFAKKYDLEIIQSIAKYIIASGINAPIKGKVEKEREFINAIIEYNGKFLLLKEKVGCKFVGGGLEKNETLLEGIKREILEETGYTDLGEISTVLNSAYYGYAYRHTHDRNDKGFDYPFFYVKLNSLNNKEISEEEKAIHELIWVEKNEVKDLLFSDGHKYPWDCFINEKAFTEYGVLVNSGEFTGLTTEEAKVKLVELAEKEGFGTKKVNFKLRDWLFSRQRYWGEPIPLIHLEKEQLKGLEHISDLSEAKDLNKAYLLKRAEKEGEKCDGAKCPCGSVRELVIDGKVFSKVYDGIYGKIVCDYRLPLELPEVEDFAPAGDGNSPLAKVDDFVNIRLADNLTGKRETNTMPQWGGSCWYYLRYMDNENNDMLVDPEVEKYWGQVDSYVGGAEHAVLHLLYARFWHKFLFDIGVVSSDEPFYRLRNQGLILAHAFQRKNGGLVPNDMVVEKDGKYYEIEACDKVNGVKDSRESSLGGEVDRIVSKMSKSLKNVVNPDDIVEEYGADSLRLYEMVIADFKDAAPWDSKGIIGVRRFIEKSERLFTFEAKLSTEDDTFTMKLLHKTIKKVEEDIENYKFNTAIASLMILVNNGLPKDESLQSEWKNIFVRLLHPFAPHLAEELWERITSPQPSPKGDGVATKYKSVFFSEWPKYDEAMTIDDTIKIGVQVLGKLRGEIEINKDEDKDSVLEKARTNEDVMKWLEEKDIVKEIYVPGKIVNIVVK